MSDVAALTANYFQLFALPVDFTIDRQLLDNSYRKLQQQFHPDRFATASAAEQRLAMQISSRINEAQQALKHPRSRAAYMLELQGRDMSSERTTNDMIFLMQQMDLREQVAEASNTADPAMTLMGLSEKTDQLEAELLNGLDDLLKSTAVEDLDQAESRVQKLQFVEKLRVALEAAEDCLG
ncbi:Fe-S protein assembly co-chaperone HscB [Pelagibaculum spongiae]|uniref:Co-chaperone protein HscB homolog n=1 Tax=Pelagibaculum spongiae TaxID=2080658 RepID=A0A2V1H557_9GAMM|nr:Fe-S protein assembly co-chaperone HscB [Pelagibaculum spongiae]PVZ72347.1 Fe-S protein assembly co-chaperone HscB [Pelagibaculum spongiae]